MWGLKIPGAYYLEKGKGNQMRISEKKKKIVIDNYFRQDCDINTSIRQAYERGFSRGLEKAIVSEHTVSLQAAEGERCDNGDQ